MPTDNINSPPSGATKRLPSVQTADPGEPLIPPWIGTTIMVRHGPDGTVTATCRGLSAVAGSEWAALEELARLVKAARPGSAAADTPRPKAAG